MSHVPGRLKSKLVKLRTARKLWESQEVWTANPYAKRVGKGKTGKADQRMRFQSMSFKLPLETVHVETILVDGKVVYDYAGEPTRSAILGGGGRFTIERQYFDRVVVMQRLVLKDLPLYGKDEPAIDVIVSVFVEEV